MSLFTPELGIIRAAAFGALKGKGKLHGYTGILAWAKGELYHDPVKNLWKIASVDKGESFVDLGANLKGYFAGCLFAEVYPHIYWAPEEGAELFHLLKDSLFLLVRATDEEVDLLMIQFFWRLLEDLGFSPDFDTCCKSGQELDDFTEIFYNPYLRGFSSRELADNRTLKVHRGMIKYLYHTAGLELAPSLKVKLKPEDAQILKRVLLSHIQSETNHKLKTLKMAQGIL